MIEFSSFLNFIPKRRLCCETVGAAEHVVKSNIVKKLVSVQTFTKIVFFAILHSTIDRFVDLPLLMTMANILNISEDRAFPHAEHKM
jgi:hypothetical protein